MTSGHQVRPSGARDARRPTELDVSIGALIREQRLQQNLAQEQLAKAMGVTQHQLQKYETGENRIAASRLVECARALSVPVAWFYHSIGASAQSAPQGNELTSCERALLDAFRGLGPTQRKQLIDIAGVIALPSQGKLQKKRPNRSP